MSNQIKNIRKFIKSNKLKRFTVEALIEAFRNNNYLVLYADSDSALSIAGILGVEITESDSFICNKNNMKVLFVSRKESSKLLCFKLACLFKLSNLEDTRKCTDTECVEAMVFASLLRQELEEGRISSKIFTAVKNMGLAVAAAAVLFLGSLSTELFNDTSNASNNAVTNAIANTDTGFVVISKAGDNGNEKSYVTAVSEKAETENEKITNATAEILPVIENDESLSINDDITNEENSSKSSESTDEVENTATFYYVTKTGTKYHVQTCRYVKNTSECTKIPMESISSYAYTPCKSCIK